MHTPSRPLLGAVAVLVLVATGCPKKTGDQADGSADATPTAATSAPPTPAPAPMGVNAAKVARFPNETPMNVDEDVDRPTNVRDAPPNGTIIATLPKGTKCVQIAQRERYFLIVFDDPKNPSQKLMGWVVDDSFKNAPPPVKPKCTAPDVLLMADSYFCGRVCKADADCKAGETCTGKAKLVSATGALGAETQSCVIPKIPDAGAPPTPVADAAAPAQQDAGTSPAPVADAGPAPAQDAGAAPAQTGPVIAPTGGKCPDKYRLIAETGKCHMLCAGTPAVCGNLPCSKQKFGEPAVCVPK
jgi:hypothetical protein